MPQTLRTTDHLDFDNLCNEIDRATDDLAEEILNYDPLSILHRAFWSYIAHNLEPTPEALQSIVESHIQPRFLNHKNSLKFS